MKRTPKKYTDIMAMGAEDGKWYAAHPDLGRGPWRDTPEEAVRALLAKGNPSFRLDKLIVSEEIYLN
jgi:hypothetical protein